MARTSEIERLEDRRRLLLAESDRLRRQLTTETAQLQAATGWLKAGYSLFQSVRAYWPLVVAGAGFLITKKRGGLLGSLDRIWSVWKITRKLIRLWQDSSNQSHHPLAASEHHSEQAGTR